MKIVIDIDNETYGRIQALVNADYFEHDICGYSMKRIANGIPYEERPKGEWIEGESGNIKCNQCGCEIRYSYLIGNKSDFPKFCCDCGAKMRKETEK